MKKQRDFRHILSFSLAKISVVGLFSMSALFSLSTSAYANAMTMSQQLEHFLDSKDAKANHITLDKIDKKSVLINNGSSSSSSKFIYFLNSKKNQFYVDEVIAKTETSAILNYFAVKNMQLSLTDSVEMGYQLQDKIQNNLHYTSAFEIQKTLTAQKPVEIFMGKIGLYQFFMRYQHIDEFANRTPYYVVRCQQKEYYLSPKHTIYMGYEQKDLTTPQYIVIQDQQQYRYVYANQLVRSFQQAGIDCSEK